MTSKNLFECAGVLRSSLLAPSFLYSSLLLSEAAKGSYYNISNFPSDFLLVAIRLCFPHFSYICPQFVGHISLSSNSAVISHLSLLSEHLLCAFLKLASTSILGLALLLGDGSTCGLLDLTCIIGLAVLLVCSAVEATCDLATSMWLSREHLLRCVIAGNLILCLQIGIHICSGSSRLFANNIEHRVLQRFFVFVQAILLPGVVRNFGI